MIVNREKCFISFLKKKSKYKAHPPHKNPIIKIILEKGMKAQIKLIDDKKIVKGLFFFSFESKR